MDYKEKDIWNRIHKMYDDMDETGKSQVERVFPELKESEDERIRKALIDIVNARCELYKGITKEMFLAWLEKQGDINPTEDELEALRIAAYEPTKNWSEKLQSLYEKLTHCEQKPTDKVEPKFKVGDWIIDNNIKTPFLITDISNEKYDVISIYGTDMAFSFREVEHFYQLWTIQDAKDGDVLADKDNNIGIYKEIEGIYWDSYIYLGCDGELRGFSIGGKHEQPNTHPATKEQRDLLFQKMNNAGFTFDFEKKALKKIEQKPAWSEEDEEHLNSIISDIKTDMGAYPRSQEAIDIYNDDISFLKSLKERVQPQTKREWSEEDDENIMLIVEALNYCATANTYEKQINWLKSLRPQSHWKPSEENIKDLEWCAKLVKDNLGTPFHRIMVFIDELKKLKG